MCISAPCKARIERSIHPNDFDESAINIYIGQVAGMELETAPILKGRVYTPIQIPMKLQTDLMKTLSSTPACEWERTRSGSKMSFGLTTTATAPGLYVARRTGLLDKLVAQCSQCVDLWKQAFEDDEFKFSSFTILKNMGMARHMDKTSVGAGLLLSLGSFTGGEVKVHDVTMGPVVIPSLGQIFLADLSQEHWTAAYQSDPGFHHYVIVFTEKAETLYLPGFDPAKLEISKMGMQCYGILTSLLRLSFHNYAGHGAVA